MNWIERVTFYLVLFDAHNVLSEKYYTQLLQDYKQLRNSLKHSFLQLLILFDLLGIAVEADELYTVTVFDNELWLQ